LNTRNTEPLVSSISRAVSSGRINSAFEKFLEDYINIPASIRSDASTSQQHIREFLQEECVRDATFPPVLEQGDSDFISGSFGRHTKIWPLDDIDLFFPLDGAGLYYFRNGITTPNTVVTDGNLVSNPLLGPRWASQNRISSTRLVSEFRAVLNRHYSRSEVSANGEAVTVQLTLGANDESDGLNFDVVPCFRLNPHDGSSSFYLIPDGRDGWKHTNPRLDEAVCADLQKYNQGHYRKVIKLVKYWNEVHFEKAFTSYYVELALANRFSDLMNSGQRMVSVSGGVIIAFNALRDARLRGDIPSPVPLAAPVDVPTLNSNQDLKLTGAVELSAAAFSDEGAGRAEQAVSRWKEVFGEAFGQD
jgi:hypothetical protein